MTEHSPRAETRTVERIDWPAVVKSWTIGGHTHAMCCCQNCMKAGTPPLCGFSPSPTSVGAMGRPLDCTACIAILRSDTRRAEHGAQKEPDGLRAALRGLSRMDPAIQRIYIVYDQAERDWLVTFVETEEGMLALATALVISSQRWSNVSFAVVGLTQPVDGFCIFDRGKHGPAK